MIDKLKDFMNTGPEKHAFTIGICEVVCPWPPRHGGVSKQLIKQLKREHHYYMLGRAVGIIAWVTICCVVKQVCF